MGSLQSIWEAGGEEKGWADFEWQNLGRNADFPFSRLVKEEDFQKHFQNE
jgi:hypothetical protein